MEIDDAVAIGETRDDVPPTAFPGEKDPVVIGNFGKITRGQRAFGVLAGGRIGSGSGVECALPEREIGL
jgi:hypothetical protein